MNQPKNVIAVAKSSINSLSKQPPHFQKVNVDCWEKIFDYLSLRDILSMSKTCRRMHQIGGYYFRQNFPEVQCKWIGNRGIYIGYPNSVIRNDLCPFITKLSVYDYLEDRLDAETYYSLKTLTLRSIELTETQVGFIKGLLNVVENVDLRRCTIYGDFYERFLKFCTQLKRLSVDEVTFVPNAAENSLFEQVFPTLQGVEYAAMKIEPETAVLKVFLEQNESIKHFGVDAASLWANRDSLLGANIKLNSLAIHTSFSDEMIPADEFVKLLSTLHEKGFYKSLHLSMIYTDEEVDYQEWINKMADLNAFERLIANQDVNLSHLTHLRELCIWEDHTATDMEVLATNLTNLERLFFYKATTDDILPFFTHSKKLKTVKVYQFHGGALLRAGALNLIALNREREKLKIKRTVFVCVENDIYLATKYMSKNFDLKFVEIARLESDELGAFDRYYYF